MSCQEGKYIWPGIDNLAFTPLDKEKKTKSSPQDPLIELKTLHLRSQRLTNNPAVEKKGGGGNILLHISSNDQNSFFHF